MKLKTKRKVCSTQIKRGVRRNYTRRQVANSYTHWLHIRQAEKQIRCDICKQVFSEKDIWSHVEIHIGASKVQEDDYVISSRGEQKRQQLEVERSAQKKQILSSSRNNEENVAYTAVHNANRMLFASKELKLHGCSVCQKQYSRKDTLTLHMRRHTGEKPFECDICKKCFFRKGDIRQHMVAHSGLKPFHCVTCGLYFARRSILVKHSLIHSRIPGLSSVEKPFACDICKKPFQRKDSIRRHMALHTMTDQNRFKCPTCGSSFRQKSHLKRHIDRVHFKPSPTMTQNVDVKI